MKPFVYRGYVVSKSWLIERKDVRMPVLLAGGQEVILTSEDVGKLYVIDEKNGDHIEAAPEPDADEEHETTY